MKQLVGPRAPRPTSRRSGRRRHPRLGTMLAVVVAAVCAGAASGAVTTSLEPVAGSPLRRGVATTVLAIPAERLFAAMADLAHWPEFMPYMTRSTVVAGTPGEVWEQRLELPLPLRDRQYRVRVQADRDDTGRWFVAWRHVPGSGNLRGLDGRMTLRAIGGDRTAVELRLWSDLGGFAPVATQEAMLRRSLGWILDGLQQQAGRCRYSDAQPSA